MVYFSQDISSAARTTVHERDLESQELKKVAAVSVTPLPNSSTEKPVLGQRRIASGPNGTGPHTLLTDDIEEDALGKIEKFFKTLRKTHRVVAYSLYIIPVAALLAIPLLIFTIGKYKDVRADGVRLRGLFIWIEVLWVTLWLTKLASIFAKYAFQSTIGAVSKGLRKYWVVIENLEIPFAVFLWTIVAWGTSCLMYNTTPEDEHTALYRDNGAGNQPGVEWIRTVRLVFKAGIIVALIFLGEKLAMQLLSINYHRKQYFDKISESKKMIKLLDLMYDESAKMYPPGQSHIFREEDDEITGNASNTVSRLAKAGMGKRMFSEATRARKNATKMFGNMASDITGQKLFDATGAHATTLGALRSPEASKALARRLWMSFAAPGQDALYQHDLHEVLGPQNRENAEKIFHVLDRDDNGDVSLEEMEMLVVECGQGIEDREKSMKDIASAIATLDKLLSFAVVCAIAFIYATFFSKAFATKTAQLWTSFTGLAFAIGGTVTEFLACCIFLFVKHPYDVGDRVNIDHVELTVKYMSLMYTVFRRVDNDGLVQIPNNVANGMWIENISRSKQMKERLSLNVASTTKMEDILALRSELKNFVTAEDNRRDFQPEFDVELRSIGDMKSLELRVEIKHKSNFHNETVRNSRRNKFMCELLAACRRVPIEPPGGAAPPLGDPANPSYSVSVSDGEAKSARAVQAEKVESARLYPTGTSIVELVPEASRTDAGLLTPALAMFPGLRARHGHSEGARRPSAI